MKKVARKLEPEKIPDNISDKAVKPQRKVLQGKDVFGDAAVASDVSSNKNFERGSFKKLNAEDVFGN